MQNTPCLYCFGLNTLCGFSRHVKSAHLLANLVFQASHVVFYLQVSSLPVIFPSFIPLASWGWFLVQSSSILGLFEFHFMCFHLFCKNPQVVRNHVNKLFAYPLIELFETR
jgi:hypothetical protein